MRRERYRVRVTQPRRYRLTLRLVVAVATLTGAFVAAGSTAAAPRVEAGTPVWVVSARAQLARLPVHAPAPIAGYSRAAFGPAWEDVDHNGCDTRNDILKRDLRSVVFKAGSHCTVLTGILHDPYTGRTMHFLRGLRTSSLVQIDHLVALGDAWQTGANRWSGVKRLAFANDPVELLAVNGSANEAKGDADASGWLPPNRSFRCAYVAKQITVKTKYRLWVAASEKSAMARTLSNCSASLPPAPKPPPPAQTTPAPGTPATVTPGAFCSDQGATGVSKSGAHYVCTTSATDSRLRWRRSP